jgi:hypothetical protein
MRTWVEASHVVVNFATEFRDVAVSLGVATTGPRQVDLVADDEYVCTAGPSRTTGINVGMDLQMKRLATRSRYLNCGET